MYEQGSDDHVIRGRSSMSIFETASVIYHSATHTVPAFLKSKSIAAYIGKARCKMELDNIRKLKNI